MDISAIGGDEYLNYSVLPEFDAGGDGARVDQIFKKILEKRDADDDGSLDKSEFKIPEEKFLKSDSDGNGLLSEEELKAEITEKVEQLKVLLSGYEHMQAGQGNQAEKGDIPSSLLDFLKIELPGNGIDDDGDGEIDEDDTGSLLDVLNNDGEDEDDASSLFDLLI
jgi:Ca2+-binding EF-hand superfamily protein